MTNYQVYKKILSFSFVMLAFSLIELIAISGASVGGYFIFKSGNNALLGLAIGFVLGVIIAVLINVFIVNRVKAAQLAMIAKGVTDGELPEHVYKAGMEEVKGRFASIFLFFLVTGAIKGVFRQIGYLINKLGTAIGGNAGNAVTSTIDTGVQILIGYLCDCCLGWIMYRKEENAAKAGCEGAVIFFKNGKTLLRNIGRIFGMGFISLALIGGGLFGISYLIFSQFPTVFENLSQEILKAINNAEGTASEIITNPTYLMLFVCALVALFIWSSIHSVLIRPFILVGVMRNYMKVGLENLPKEEDFKELCGKSKKFNKLYNKM